MKSILAVGLIVFLVGVVSAKPTNDIPESDMILGTLGPDDYLHTRRTNITLRPGNNFAQFYVVVNYLNFTYVALTESGEYPDARATLLNGGPNYNFVDFQLTPGPLGNFNYIMEIWGVDIEGDVKNSGESYVYFRNN